MIFHRADRTATLPSWLGLAALVENEIERPGHDEQILVAVGVDPVQTRIAQDRRLGVPFDSSSRGY